MPNVFISYRRTDTTSGYASWIYDRLAASLGRKHIFMDIDSLPLGVDFVEHLERALAATDVALILIGPGWVDATDETGARRLDDPADFVRIEVAAALRASLRVIPVLVDGAHMPNSRELPEDLRPLVRRQALAFQRHGGAAIRDLLAAIEQTAPEGERAEQETAAREAAEREHAAAVQRAADQLPLAGRPGPGRQTSRRRWLVAPLMLGAIIGVVIVALIAGGSPTTGAHSGTNPPPPPSTTSSVAPKPHAVGLGDLALDTSQLTGSASPGAATVGGKIVSGALLITLSSVPTGTVALTLGGMYRTLNLVAGQASTEAGVPGSAMNIQISADSTPIFSARLVPGRAPIQMRSIPLHNAQTLEIVVSDPSGSIYDEAVVAGSVKT